MGTEKDRNEGDGSRNSDWDENGSSRTKTRDRADRKTVENARAKADGEDKRQKFHISKKTLIIGSVCVGVLVIGVFLYWLHSRNFVSTDDAYTTTHVHEISARSKADLAHVTEHRADVAALKSRVDELLSLIGQTDERIAVIDTRRKLVDEVQNKANAIVHLLEDVRINLETLGEQKAVIDHVSEKVAQLEFMLQEARNTLRTLQHERQIAERIEQNIKQLRARTGPSDEGKRTSA